jgi:hypothetical protein
MSDKRQKNQLQILLAFTDEGRSEDPEGSTGRDRIAQGETRERKLGSR